MATLDTILSHVQLPESKRDLTWEKTFLKLLPDAFATLVSDTPESGPDNFPYLLVDILPTSQEPIVNILDWLTAKGIGLVINAKKNYPDYILSFGMLWNFRERKEFYTDNPIQADKVFVVEPSTEFIAGAPHPQYLPDYVRSIIRQFLIEQGVFRPRILVIGNPNQTAHSQFDLCFSIEALGNPPQQEHEGILKALSWFLPPHYSLALVSEKGLPAFVDL